MSDPSEQAEDHRRRAIRAGMDRLDRAAPRVLRAIPTGFPALDQALGAGGFPRSAISEVFGPPSSGKTTLALQWVAHLQAGALAAAWIDADHTFDPTYAAALGVSLDGLPLACPESAEEALEMARSLALSGAVDAVIVDSAAALAPQIELGAGVSGPGLQSRVIASGLKALARAMSRSDAALLFLNQTRSRMNPSQGEPETSAGGPSLKLYAALRLVLDPVHGRTVRFRTLKDKASAAFREGALRLGGGLGFANTP
jgi:recombination protein RecA